MQSRLNSLGISCPKWAMKCKYLCSLWKLSVFWTQRLHLKLVGCSRTQFYSYAPIQSELGSAVLSLLRLFIYIPIRVQTAQRPLLCSVMQFWVRVGLHWSRPAHLVCCYSNSTKSSRTSPSQHKPEQTHQKSWNGRKWSENAWWSTPAGWGCTCEADWCTGSGQCSYSQLGGLDNKVYLSRILDVLLVLYVDACAETRKRCLL